jgi:hypothetical protein
VLVVAPATGALPRATADRPDERAGPQVHLVYALPSDGADRALDTDGTVAASVANFQGWLRGQTGGRGLKVDTFQGEPDVTFVRLSETDAQLAARGLYLRDEVERQLRVGGLDAADKIYAVHYDGSNAVVCGGGAWPPTLPGKVASVYMRATYGQGLPCYDASRSRAGLHLMDLAVLHELLHTLGFVPICAPRHTRAGHVSDDPNDLMRAGGGSWTPSILDSGRNDYFGVGANLPGCPDLSASLYLEGNEPPPPPAQPPALPAPPTVLTGRAERVTAGGVTIRGSVDGHGALVTVRVQYGPTSRYGGVSARRRVRGAGHVAIRIEGLRPGRTYHYRLRGTSVSGSAVGGDRTFRTRPRQPAWLTERQSEMR